MAENTPPQGNRTLDDKSVPNTGGEENNVFHEGDLAILIDRKGRRYLLNLAQESTFHTHVGTLPHREIIGQQQGGWFRTSHGQSLLALKPTLAEYVLEMPRGTQILYPKDLGNILIMADIFPGATVVEAGLGSGALTATLLRAVGEKGRVITYEQREDMVKRAMGNVKALVPNISNHTLKMGDVYQGIHEREVARIVLDVPEPWHVVPWAAQSLSMGGIFLSFLPTILQVHHLVEDLSADSRFHLIETVEVLLRPWSVAHRSVRPAHRMVAHTGFITTARRCSPRSNPSLEPAPENGSENLESDDRDE